MLTSSIGRKAAMAMTGLLLFGFVVVHMLGNLQIFLGPDNLNRYAAMLKGMPELLWLARGGLLAIFVVHVGLAWSLTRENRAARPHEYYFKMYTRASYASRTMWMSGVIVFAFVVYHLLHFTFGAVHSPGFHRTTMLDGKEVHDVYAMVILGFQNVFVSGAYLVAQALLCLHLSHGVSSLFQSLGFGFAKYRKFTDGVGPLAAAVIFVGNSSMPLAVLAGVLRLPS